MADASLTLTAWNAGEPVAVDDNATDSVPYTKLMFGASGTRTHVEAGAGLPVTPDSGGFAVSATLDAETTKVIGTVNLSATDNAVLDTIDAVLDAINAKLVTGTVIGEVELGTTPTDNLATIAGAVSGSEMQVDIVSIPAGSAEYVLGTATYTEATSAGVGIAAVRNDTLAALANTDNEWAPLQVDASGALYVTGSGGSITVDGSVGLTANSGVDIGDVDVTSISAGTNLIGDVGLSGARTSGGTTLYKNIDVDESEDQVKATAGQVYWINAINLRTSPLYLKLYNATAASVVVGTTVPDLTFAVPSAGSANGAGFVLTVPNGIAFSTAITVAATTGVADADSGAPSANELILNMGYA